jgi:precorrin-2 dehydrogenase/sirohydrochlorin ferrochelatase
MTEQPPLLPVFLKMKDRPCLIVGGGRIALEKIRVLLESQASIRAVAPEALDEVHELADQGRITLQLKKYDPADLDDVAVVIAATDDGLLNHRVYREAVARGRLVNVVDDPAYCDFYFGSIVRRGSLQVAISTAGESPAFAQQLKHEIDEALPPDTGTWLARLGETRRHVNRVVKAGPRRIALLRELARREACDPVTCPCRSLT